MKALFNVTAGIFCLLLLSTQVQAQRGRESKWSAGIVFSPDYAYRLLKSESDDNGWKEAFDELEKPKVGYTTGISILYMLHRKLEIESGLLYSNKGSKINLSNFTSFDKIDLLIPQEITTINNYRYLVVPLKINWVFLKKKARLFLSAGMSADFFLDEFTVQEVIFPDKTETDRNNQEDMDFNAVILSLSGGAGLDYPLNKHLFIRINPEVRHGIIPIADATGKRYNWSVGLNTGLYFRMKNKGNIIFAQKKYRKRR